VSQVKKNISFRHIHVSVILEIARRFFRQNQCNLIWIDLYFSRAWTALTFSQRPCLVMCVFFRSRPKRQSNHRSFHCRGHGPLLQSTCWTEDSFLGRRLKAGWNSGHCNYAMSNFTTTSTASLSTTGIGVFSCSCACA